MQVRGRALSEIKPRGQSRIRQTLRKSTRKPHRRGCDCGPDEVLKLHPKSTTFGLLVAARQSLKSSQSRYALPIPAMRRGKIGQAEKKQGPDRPPSGKTSRTPQPKDQAPPLKLMLDPTQVRATQRPQGSVRVKTPLSQARSGLKNTELRKARVC